jgi:hypothetical protein
MPGGGVVIGIFVDRLDINMYKGKKIFYSILVSK